MAYETKNMTGTLHKNLKKEKDSHADYNGSVLIEGREYWLNAWLKTAKNGTKFMSLALKAKDGRAAYEPAQHHEAHDEEIPF